MKHPHFDFCHEKKPRECRKMAIKRTETVNSLSCYFSSVRVHVVDFVSL
uniref:Uncharacterized protein n=1 Tax=Lutzomyia longipalpis TaxID=7200 RepID=A0A1B0CML9_LUTLO